MRRSANDLVITSDSSINQGPSVLDQDVPNLLNPRPDLKGVNNNFGELPTRHLLIAMSIFHVIYYVCFCL